LLLREIFVFDKRLVVVLAQLFAEEILYKADVRRETVHAERLVRFGRLECNACVDDWALVLRLVAAVQTVLEKVEWHANSVETKLFHEAELAEAKEVLIEIFSEVAADELFAAVVEGADTVCACVVAECWSLLFVRSDS